MYKKFVFALKDADLFDVINQASIQEKKEFEGLLSKKKSCNLPENPETKHLVSEFQLMGGNTFSNLAREHGVAYQEILSDVAKVVLKKSRDSKNKFNEAKDVGEKETIIAEYIIDRAIEKMSPEEREEFLKLVDKEAKKRGFHSFIWNTKSIGSILAVNVLRYIILRLIAEQFLKKAGVKILVKVAGGKLAAIIAGPIGWVIAAIWLAIDIAGPAYSVTVPGVMLVASIRARQSIDSSVSKLEQAASLADQKINEVGYE